MGTLLRALREGYPMNANTIGLGWFFKDIVLWMKVASALAGLIADM